LREMKLRHVLEFDMEISLWDVYKKYKDVEELDQVQELAADVANYHKVREAVILQAVKEYHDLVAYFTQPDVTVLYKPVIDKALVERNDLTAYFDETDTVELYKQEFLAQATTDHAQDDKDKSLLDATVAKIAAIVDTIKDDGKGDAKDKAVVNEMTAKINAIHKMFNIYFSDLKDARKESYFISQRLAEWDKEGKDLDRRIFLQMNRLNAVKETLIAFKETDPNHPKILVEKNLLSAMQNIVRPMLNEERTQLVALVSAHEKLSYRKLNYANLAAKALKQEDAIRLKLTPLQKKIAQLEAQIKGLEDEVQRFKTPPELDSVKKYFSVADVTEMIYNRFQQVHPKLLDKLTDTINDFHKQVTNIFEHIVDEAVQLVMIKTVIVNLQVFKQAMERSAAAITEAELGTATLASIETKAQELEIVKENVLLVLEDELEKLKDIKFVLENSKQSPDGIRQAIKDKETEMALVQQSLASARKEAEGWQSQIDDLDILHVTEEVYVSTYVPAPPKIADIIAQKLDEFRVTLMNKDQYDLLNMIFDLFKAQPERYPLWLQYMIVHFSGMRYSSSHGSWADPRYLYVRLTNLAVTNPQAIENLLKAVQAQMTPEQALVKVQEMKDQFPPWMWKEIVAVSDLRVNEVDEADEDIHNWERLTVAEQHEKNLPQWAKYREIINEWKPKYLTSWREEHDRAHRLIVRSSVCNEVAEHIQHLRGHHGAAGLSGKPDWYRGTENKYKALPDPKPKEDVPFFIWPRKFEDYHVGASILWLKYKNEPAFPWEEVKDMKTAGGDRLVPDKYLTPASLWKYQSNGITRRNSETQRQEYLFWIHEATVAGLAETAEGNVVLTFETALPYEDRRLAAVGIFKRNDYNLLFDGGEDSYNGSFLGYIPENQADIPMQDLDEMLNWDHILLK